MIILGGGIVKHHVCNANLMRNGADFSVYVNTGQTIRPLRPNHRAAVRPAPRVCDPRDATTASRRSRFGRTGTPARASLPHPFTRRRAARLFSATAVVPSVRLSRALLRRSSLSRVLLLRLRRKRPRLVMTWYTRVSP